MLLDPKQRGFPAIHGVTLSAFAFPGASGELASVRVGFMTIDALGKGQRPFEGRINVALNAAHLGVQTEQWILRFRMIEFETGQHLLPARRRVALFAPLLEGSLVRIDVAGRASREVHVLITRRAPGLVGLVAFLASHLDVQPGERVARLRVIELFRRLPIREVVAPLAIVAQLAFVRIGMAQHAVRR